MTESYAARITPMGKAYVEWVTSLDTEPPLDGAFNAGWRAREREIERLQAVVEAAQREEQRHLQRVDELTRDMPPDKQQWYRQAHTAGCDLAGVLALNAPALAELE